MVKEGIVLGHKISHSEIEVDKAKIETTEKLPPLFSSKDIRSFLGHVGFYRWFIKDFLKISNPMTKLLENLLILILIKSVLNLFNYLWRC